MDLIFSHSCHIPGLSYSCSRRGSSLVLQVPIQTCVFFPRGSETECLKVTLQNLRARRLHQSCAAVRCARTSAQIVFHTPTTVADHDESMSYRNFAAWTGPGALAVRGPCLSRPPMHSCSSLHFFFMPVVDAPRDWLCRIRSDRVGCRSRFCARHSRHRSLAIIAKCGTQEIQQTLPTRFL